MACEINASPSNGLVQSADGSGIIKLKSNGVTTNALAWVNFNGTGTVAIRSSYNVSSITDNGTGDYTVNFATALSDANYAALALGTIAGFSTSTTLSNTAITYPVPISYTTGSVRFRNVNPADTANTGGGPIDSDIVNVAIFGN
jgi:hypothetical protein